MHVGVRLLRTHIVQHVSVQGLPGANGGAGVSGLEDQLQELQVFREDVGHQLHETPCGDPRQQLHVSCGIMGTFLLKFHSVIGQQRAEPSEVEATSLHP